MDNRYIGLMSGTSLDGIDGVLVRFDPSLTVQCHVSAPFPDALREVLLQLNTRARHGDELHQAALASNELSQCYARVCAQLLQRTGLPASAIRAIGSHGQTIRHQPAAFDGIGYTLQLQAPALLAELTGIDVIADFRSRDIAAGGQGAPLAPAFHAAVFADSVETTLVLNVGGFSNLTVLRPEHPILGFDCGPGNVLMDAWCTRHLGMPFDHDGQWAAQGQVVPALLQVALSDPYFAQRPPKSTGRDQFHLAWLEQRLSTLSPPLRPVDVQATLCELTAVACAQDIQSAAPDARTLLVCGGGALNGELMRRLQSHLPHVSVHSTQARGLPPQQVEACAFAWLARTYLQGQTGNRPEVTGARGPRILGAHYPA